MTPNNASLTQRLFSSIKIVFVLCIVSVSVSSQTTSATDGSTPLGLQPGAPAGSYPLSGFDNVNLYNGGLSFQLPLLSIAGRGGAAMPVLLPIDGKWRVLDIATPQIGGGFHHTYLPIQSWWENNDRKYSPGSLAGRQMGYDVTVCPDNTEVFSLTLTRLTFTGPDGTEYELRDQLRAGQPANNTNCTYTNPPSRGTVFVSSDGSAATFVSDTTIYDQVISPSPSELYPSGYLTLRDGTKFRIDGGVVSWLRDRNGNKMSFTYDSFNKIQTITDSLNRQVTISRNTGPGTFDQMTYKGFGGTQRTIKVNYSSLASALRSDYASTLTPKALFPELNGSNSSQHNPTVVSSVTLPNNQQYVIKYNQYGEVARVVLPTGGAIEYDYAAGGDYPSGSSTGYGGSWVVYRRVVERRVYPDGSSGSSYASRMTYSRTDAECAGCIKVDQFNNAGTLLTRSKHYFYGNAGASFLIGPIDYPSWKDSKEFQTDDFAGDGTTLLHRTVNTWQQRAAVSWWTGGADLAPPNDPRLSETTNTLVDTNQVSKQTFAYDDTVPFNNRSDVYEYDFGTGAAGPLRRCTHTDYLKINPVNSTDYTIPGYSLRSLPTQTQVFDSSGVEKARTTFEYDNYASDGNHAALEPRAGISGLDSSFTSSFTIRGNVTRVTNWILSSGTQLYSHSQYDVAGNILKAIDPRGNATLFDFADRFGAPDSEARSNTAPSELGGGTSYAFATKVTNAANHFAFAQFDYYLGRPVNGEDANGIVASGNFNDALDRPVQVIRAIGTGDQSQTSFAYDDANRIVTTSSDKDTYCDNLLVAQAVYDPMGRTIEARQYEGGGNYIVTQTQYDALGRAYKTSNPFRPWQSETAQWTTHAFDALGRVTSVTTPDNAAVSTSYSGNSVTVTDPAGKKRRSVSDALGRLMEVYEDPNGLNYQTSYLYDTLDNLVQVTQGSQQRFFMYDSLKRLIRARNPEQGTLASLNLSDPLTGNGAWSLGYVYDAGGNLTQKTDARGVVSTYVYDVLNRNTTIDYSDTSGNPDVTRFYDGATNGKGRFWTSYSGGDISTGSNLEHTAVDSYDAGGRVLVQRQMTKLNGVWSTAYQTSRLYNLAGAVRSQTYASGHTVSYTYDGAGRTLTFTGYLGDGVWRNYASSLLYSSRNQITQELFGTQMPLYHKLQYNVRGQLWDVRVSTAPDINGSWNRGCLQFFYDGTLSFGGSGPDNNGNVLEQKHYVPLDEQSTTWAIHDQSYTYDSLNRLSAVSESFGSSTQSFTQQLVQSYSYDRWGNRTINAAQTWGAGVNNKQFMVDPANTNRLLVPSGQVGTMIYDAAGNLTTDTYTGAGNRTYDAENRMTTATDNTGQTSVYTYNGEGKRVRRKVSSNQEEWLIYGIEGELLAEYQAAASPSAPKKEYGYRDGQLLVTAAVGSGGISGLVGYWKFDENSGTTAADASGNNNTGTLSAGASWATGQSGAATTLDGVDDYVQVGTQSSLVMTSAATFSAWIFPTGPGSNATAGGIIVNKEGEYEIARFTDGTIQWAFANTNPAFNWISTGYVAPLNQWTHVSVTYDNGVIKTYINGTLTHTYSGAGAIGDVVTAQNDFRIGGRQLASQNFQGRIDEVRVYNRALSASEVATLPGPTTSGLSGYWKFDENSGTTAADASGNNNTGTLSAGASWTTGQSGAATTLDGVDDYVQVGAQSSLVMTSAATFSAWIYPTGPGSQEYIGGIIVNKEGEYEITRFPDGTIQWAFANTNPGWNWINTGYVAPLSQWTHVTITYDNGVVKTYINGTLTHTYNGAGTIGDIIPSQNDFRIGGRQGLSNNFQGRIDEVRVYNRTLSASEVATLPNSSSSSGTAQITWLVPDHLGTPRIIVDQTGALANVKRHDYLPFGEELFAPTGGRTAAQGYTTGDAIRQQFTAKERDIETGLDYFGARYYGSLSGRFTSADPWMASGRASLPQSWNRYSYVLNNPLNLIDPSGLEDDDPQDPKKKKEPQPKPTETPLPKVTVTTSTDPRATNGTEPKANVSLPDGNYATGVMAPLTLTITDRSGNPLQGLTVTETNKVIEAEPATDFKENPSTVTTDANGSFTDIVFGNAALTSNKVSGQEATQIVQNQIESRVKVVTEQTLTISAPNQGIIATAVYQRTITNLDEKGNRRPAFDSSGRRHVNNFSINVTPVTVSRPKSP